MFLAACSSPAPAPKQPKAADAFGPGPATASGKNPLDKYLELAGFRLSESGAGKLKVKIRLVPSTFKPGDEPISEFEAKIPSLGPEETKDVSANAATKLRLYE